MIPYKTDPDMTTDPRKNTDIIKESMFSFILYAIVSFVVALLLTLFAVAIRPLKSRDEFRPGKVLITFLMVALVAPYIYVEGISKFMGEPMKTAVEEAFDQSKIDGPLLYYRVHYYWGNKARVYVVGREKQEWGGYDRPIIDVKLVRDGKEWKAISFEFIQSDRLNKDHVTYPPYW
jgi:hypothetical protein